jgi:hypothetical protein
MTINTQLRGRTATGGRPPGNAPHSLAERSFRQRDVPAVRVFTRAFGARTGIEPGRLTDFVLAVSEATACAAGCGPCTLRVRLWVTGPRAFCEVRGDGMLRRASPAVRPDGPDGRPGPGGQPGEEEALRHWVLKQLADYVSVVSAPDGVRVLLSMTVS